MHLTILASDLDGTLAEDGQIAPTTWEALHAAKVAHLTLVLPAGWGSTATPFARIAARLSPQRAS